MQRPVAATRSALRVMDLADAGFGRGLAERPVEAADGPPVRELTLRPPVTADPPAVSVLMTVHNGQRHLEQAARSVLRQRGCTLEFVIVDDGSTDATPRLLRRLAAEDARVRVLRLESNAGISRAANAGIAACRATRIARMDADDVMHPDRLERQRRFFDAAGAVAVGTDVDFIDFRGRRLHTIESPRGHESIEEGLLRGHCTLWHTSSMIDAAAVRGVGGYDPAYSSAVDVELWLRLAEVGRLANQPEVLQHYRFYGGSVSGVQRERQAMLCERAVRAAAARRGIESPWEGKPAWREGDDRLARQRCRLKRGWWAQLAGEHATAAWYARKCLLVRPHDRSAWRLLQASLRSRKPFDRRVHPRPVVIPGAAHPAS